MRIFIYLLIYLFTCIDYSHSQIITTNISFKYGCTDPSGGANGCNILDPYFDSKANTYKYCIGNRLWLPIVGKPSISAGGFLQMHADILYPAFGTEMQTAYTFKANYIYQIGLVGDFSSQLKIIPYVTNIPSNNFPSSSNGLKCGTYGELISLNPSNQLKYFTEYGSSATYADYELTVPSNITFDKLGLICQTAVTSTAAGNRALPLSTMTIKEIPPVSNNEICCSQIFNAVNYNPTVITQVSSKSLIVTNGATPVYQWQLSVNGGSTWSNIVGATQATYDDPNPITSGSRQYRRQVSAWGYTSTSNVVTVKAQDLVNTLCCDQVLYVDNTKNPSIINGQISNALGAVTYKWQYTTDNVNWNNIASSNTASYDPPAINWTTKYRRIATTAYQTSTSNEITVELRICDRPTVAPSQEVICGNQYFYGLTNGTQIQPLTFLGNQSYPSISSREFDYQWVMSVDKGLNWVNVGPGRSNNQGRDGKNYDYTPSVQVYDLWYGTKEIWYQRKYAEYYDDWSCNFLGASVPCGADWHEKQNSNIVKVVLSGFIDPDNLYIVGPSNILCTVTSFNISLGGSNDLGNIASVNWSTDNQDWVVDPGSSIWGATIRPFANYTTGRSDCRITAQIMTKEGKSVTRYLYVQGPPQPSFSVNPNSVVSICNNQSSTVAVTSGAGTTVTFEANGLALGAISKSGNVTSLIIPATQWNTAPQNLSIKVTDANQCKSVKSILVLPKGDSWIQDKPWTGDKGPQLVSQNDIYGDNRNANIVAELRNNIYYVGFNSSSPNYSNSEPQTLLTLQWDASVGEWKNFAFPKLNPIQNCAGPLAIFEDVNNIRKIYYVTAALQGYTPELKFIQSKSGYVNEFLVSISNWTLPSKINTSNVPLDFITPVDNDRVLYRAENKNLYLASNIIGTTEIFIANNVKGSSCLLVGNDVYYVSSSGGIKRFNLITLSDVPGIYNSVIAHDLAQIVYSSVKNIIYTVNLNGKIVMLDLNTNAIFTYGGNVVACSKGISINKKTGVLYFVGSDSDPIVANGIAYQCFYNGVTNNLNVRALDPIMRSGGTNPLTNTMLFTDYNLFYVNNYTSTVMMDYYLAGTCGPGVTRMGDGLNVQNDEVSVQDNNAALGNNVRVVPNPTSGDFEVHYNMLYNADVKVDIYNALGTLLYSEIRLNDAPGQNNIVFKNVNLQNGIYLVRFIQNGELKTVQRLVVQN
jgi:hypothetical protein